MPAVCEFDEFCDSLYYKYHLILFLQFVLLIATNQMKKKQIKEGKITYSLIQSYNQPANKHVKHKQKIEFQRSATCIKYTLCSCED